MVIDALTTASLSPMKKISIESCDPLSQNAMPNNKPMEISMDTMSSSNPTSTRPQKVGTYIIEKTIGKGNFSFVKLGYHTLTKVKVAIKIIDKTKLSEENIRKAQREAEILKTLHHPNIIKLYQVMESEKLLFIVTEYLPNGELYDYISQRGGLGEQVARQKFLEILAAVDHCHRNNVVHRDLKAENMLLDHRMSIKLADFGFGTFQTDGPSQLLTTWCGSPPYAAPEIFKGEPYLGTAADVWSLGVILYVLVCGVLPYNEPEMARLRQQVLNDPVYVPYWLSQSCEDLLVKMLSKVPSKRPTIAQIYRSKWISEIGGSVPVSSSLICDTTSSPGSSGQRTLAPVAPSFRPKLRSSFVCHPTSTLAAEMQVGKLDQIVIQIMENSGMDRAQILESLGRCAYDHLTATYLILGDSLRSNRHSLPQTLQPRPTEIEALLQQQQHQNDQQCNASSSSAAAAAAAARAIVPLPLLSRSSCPATSVPLPEIAPHLLHHHHHHHHHHLHHQTSPVGGASLFPPHVSLNSQLSDSHQQQRGYFSVKDNASELPMLFPAPDYQRQHSQLQQPSPTHDEIFPSSHPHQGGFFHAGPTLPRVSECSVGVCGACGVNVGGGLRRTDASPSPPASPINLSFGKSSSAATSSSTASHVAVTASSGTAASAVPLVASEGDCFEGELFPFQAEGVGSPPTSSNFSFANERQPKYSGASNNAQALFGSPSYGVNAMPNLLFPSMVNAGGGGGDFVTAFGGRGALASSTAHESDLLVAAAAIAQHRFSMNGRNHLTSFPPLAPQLPCSGPSTTDSGIGGPNHLPLSNYPPFSGYGKSLNTEDRVSGLGSSVEADSRHSSFSQPSSSSTVPGTATATGFPSMLLPPTSESCCADDAGIDIPMPTASKRNSTHVSPPGLGVVGGGAAGHGYPRRKIGVMGCRPALVEQLRQQQQMQQLAQQQQQRMQCQSTSDEQQHQPTNMEF